jgi:hypothetical protein
MRGRRVVSMVLGEVFGSERGARWGGVRSGVVRDLRGGCRGWKGKWSL